MAYISLFHHTAHRLRKSLLHVGTHHLPKQPTPPHTTQAAAPEAAALPARRCRHKRQQTKHV